MQPLPHVQPGHPKPEQVRVDVAYSDGATLSFNFQRSIRIPDLSIQIRRAGQVRKVILWDELPSRGYIQYKAVM